MPIRWCQRWCADARLRRDDDDAETFRHFRRCIDIFIFEDVAMLAAFFSLMMYATTLRNSRYVADYWCSWCQIISADEPPIFLAADDDVAAADDYASITMMMPMMPPPMRIDYWMRPRLRMYRLRRDFIFIFDKHWWCAFDYDYRLMMPPIIVEGPMYRCITSRYDWWCRRWCSRGWWCRHFEIFTMMLICRRCDDIFATLMMIIWLSSMIISMMYYADDEDADDVPAGQRLLSFWWWCTP